MLLLLDVVIPLCQALIVPLFVIFESKLPEIPLPWFALMVPVLLIFGHVGEKTRLRTLTFVMESS